MREIKGTLKQPSTAEHIRWNVKGTINMKLKQKKLKKHSKRGKLITALQRNL